jgi:hypothetical protein
MSNAESLPADELTKMAVSDLPFPSILQSNPKDVSRIRRSLKGTRGWDPKQEDDPITILRRPGKPDTLIDGNHRTEALKTTNGFAGMQVTVLITHRIPAYWPESL